MHQSWDNKRRLFFSAFGMTLAFAWRCWFSFRLLLLIAIYIELKFSSVDIFTFLFWSMAQMYTMLTYDIRN